MSTTPSNPVQSSQPKGESARRFNIYWGHGRYTIDIPNYGGGEVVETSAFDALTARVSELEKLVEGGLAAVNAARGEEQASMAGHDYTADKHAKTVTDWQRAARAALAMNSQDRA